ncbi:hypothetical protein OG948_54545 (plasmid) [Embleya sp. NBC_00888]|uniref:hypothetical protein n=1 Tax=Embleya sp. NBC_00888 TaxID=2975960 RepID=UPI002F90B2FE|nr:hypothetical protein OG948_54545 [Embleya sp. NBC_00888]
MGLHNEIPIRIHHAGHTVGRELTEEQIADLRALGPVVEVGPTWFFADYVFDAESNPHIEFDELSPMFDRMFYFRGDGQMSVSFRLPASLAERVKPYVTEGKDEKRYGSAVASRVEGETVVVTIRRFGEDSEMTYWLERPEKWPAMLEPLHADLIGGDMSALYVAWRMVHEEKWKWSRGPKPAPPPVPARLEGYDPDVPRTWPRPLSDLDKMLRLWDWTTEDLGADWPRKSEPETTTRRRRPKR